MPLAIEYHQSLDYRWRAGESVFDGKQMVLLPTDTSAGVCLALSAEWIIRRSAAADFFTWLGASRVATGSVARTSTAVGDHLSRAGSVVGDVQSLMRAAQQAARSAAAGTATHEKFKLVIRTVESKSRLRAVSEDDSLMAFLDRTADRIGPQLRREPGYKYISLSGFARRADFQHGIAAYVGEGRFAIFDPNFGEFRSDTAAAFDADIVEIIDRAYALTITFAYYVTFR